MLFASVIVLSIVASVCQAVPAAAATVAEQQADLRAKVMSTFHAGKPGSFARKSLRKGVAPLDTYVSEGWLTASYYDGGGCNDLLYAEGYSVNTCYIDDNGLGYKFQLTQDNCEGSVVQEFSDATCTTLSTTSSIDFPTSCESSGGMSAVGMCTTGSKPLYPSNSVIITYYRETGCTAAASFAGIPTNKCYSNTKASCSGANTQVSSYSDASCNTFDSSATISTTMCFTDTDDDDDAYYSPGKGADTYTMECVGAAASAYALNAGVIAGVIVAGISYLAL